MLDFLFAVGQFLCVVGLICGLILTLSNRKRYVSAPAEAATNPSLPRPDATRATIELAVLPPHRAPFIRVVPIAGVPPQREAASPSVQVERAESQRQRPRRRSTRATAQAANWERAALLTKHRKKRPEADGPPAF